jgi:dihydropteroate synthase
MEHFLGFRDRSIPLDPCALIMGVLNATPDSFSDGGLHLDIPQLTITARKMIEDGANILDIGGESSRPGAIPVDVSEEIRRVVPAIEAIRSFSQIPISVDTVKPEVALASLRAGADIINDIQGMTNPRMREIAVQERAGVAIMHMQGRPQTMQKAPVYENVLKEVGCFLNDQANLLISMGLPSRNILIDPGIGFGKTQENNIDLIKGLPTLAKMGFPILFGISRKSLIGNLTGRPVSERMAGTLAANAFALSLTGFANKGLVLRVHDVGPTWDLVRVWKGLRV